MLSLTRKADYALVAVAELAQAGGGQMSAREVAERARVPLPVLRNLLKVLTRAGILRSTPGATGGYSLAVEAADLPVRRVIEAVEGAPALTWCCSKGSEAGGSRCRLQDSCRIRRSMGELQGRLLRVLDETSVLDLVSGIGGRSEEPLTVGATALSMGDRH